MKKILLFLLLLLIATSCAMQKTAASNATCPVYYNGNSEPAASSGIMSYSEKQPTTN
jgi:hypothetical protein